MKGNGGQLEASEEFADFCRAVLKSLLPIWRQKYGKVLLFSYATKSLDLIEKFLRKQKFTYHRLDGSTPMQQRQRIVDNYNNSPNKFVFLLSTKVRPCLIVEPPFVCCQ